MRLLCNFSVSMAKLNHVHLYFMAYYYSVIINVMYMYASIHFILFIIKLY